MALVLTIREHEGVLFWDKGNIVRLELVKKYDNYASLSVKDPKTRDKKGVELDVNYREKFKIPGFPDTIVMPYIWGGEPTLEERVSFRIESPDHVLIKKERWETDEELLIDRNGY